VIGDDGVRVWLIVGVVGLLALCAVLGTALSGLGAPSRATAAAATSVGAARPAAVVTASSLSRPLIAVVGASFAAGVGAGAPGASWPKQLSRMLGWRLVVSADSGAGFVARGAYRRGPFARLLGRLPLGRLRPTVLLVQGGHNDVGRPLGLIEAQVGDLIGLIHHESPATMVGVVTVFSPAGQLSAAARATDAVIVASARRADPSVLIFDPLRENWRFGRVGDGLHPSAAGHRWIASLLARQLCGDLLAHATGPAVSRSCAPARAVAARAPRPAGDASPARTGEIRAG